MFLFSEKIKNNFRFQILFYLFFYLTMGKIKINVY